MPPTWIILAMAKVNDPSLDPIALTVIGALASTAGRWGLSFYCGFFRRFFTKNLEEHAGEIKAFFDKKSWQLFVGTFVYALSPFPSNLIFIADGFTKVNSKPIFAGFFLGRLVSYFALIIASQNILLILGHYGQSQETIRIVGDILGVIVAISVLFIDWKEVLKKINHGTREVRSNQESDPVQ